MAMSLTGAGARTRREALLAGDRTRSALRKTRIDLRRSFGFWAVLGTAALAVYFVFRFAVTEVVLWPDWSANAARSFIVIGPVFAAWTATLAQRDAMPTRVDLLDSTATPRVRRELRHAAMGALAALACYGIAAATVLGYAAQHATWGGPDLWVVLFGGAMSTFFALVGWLMGTFAPGRLTPVVAGAATLFYTAVSYTWGLTANGADALQPWRYIEGRWAIANRIFYDASPYTGMPHPAGGVLIVINASALLIAGYLWAREALRSGVIVLLAAVLLLIPGWTFANSTDALPREAPALIANPPMSCEGEVVEVCLHQAYEAQLGDAVRFSEAFHSPLVGMADLPETVTHKPYRDEPPAGTLPLNAFWTSTPVEQVMAQALAQFLMQPGSDGLTASQHAIMSWLVEQAGAEWFVGPAAELDPVTVGSDARERYREDIDAAAERFAALSPDQQRAWLEANWDALRAGNLTLEDLP